MKELNEWERGFISAFVDTDGGIYLSRRKGRESGYLKRLVFFNNSKDLLDRVQEILGTTKNYQVKNGNGYELRYYGGDMKWILPQLKLVLKEHRRLTMIEFLKHSNNPEMKENLFQKFNLTN
jgi:hypothetical protein